MSFFSKKAKQDSTERRKDFRVDADNIFKIDFHTTASRSISGLGDGKDISRTGVRFATFAPLKKGEYLEAVLFFHKDFPGSKKACVQMRVVHLFKPEDAQRFRVGACFLTSPRYAKELEAVRQFVFWLKAQQ